MRASENKLAIDTITENAQSLRSLARQLIGDEHRAEDVLQEAQLAALQQQGNPADNQRAWLIGTVRHLSANEHRASSRRTHHEQAAARHGHAPAADTVRERLETQRILAQHVEELGEPYRTAIYMRFYEDLPPRVIAEKLNIPLGTVKTRLRRGLASLRSRMDTSHDGQRRIWCAALAPLISPPPSPAPVGPELKVITGTTLLGGIVMSSKQTTIATAALALVIAAASWIAVQGNMNGRGSSEVLAAETTPLQVTEDLMSNSTEPDRLEDTAKRSPVAKAASAEEQKAVFAGWSVTGRVTNKSGNPLASASVELSFGAGDSLSLTTDDEGCYASDLPRPASISPHALFKIAAWATHIGHRPAESEHSIEVDSLPFGDELRIDFELESAAVLQGRLLDPDNHRAANTPVAIVTAKGEVLTRTKTRGDGRFILGLSTAPETWPTDGIWIAAGNATDGYITTGPISPLLGLNSDLGTLILERKAILEGCMRYGDGSPIANMSFRIVQEKSKCPEGTTPDEAWLAGSHRQPQAPGSPQIAGFGSGFGETDDKGRFRAQGLGKGTYRLDVWGLNNQFNSPRSESLQTSKYADIVFDRYCINVTVTDTNGLAIPGASVGIIPTKGIRCAGVHARVRSTEGVFSTGVCPGPWAILVSKNGATPIAKNVYVGNDGHLTELAIVLDFTPKTGNVALQFSDEAGKPFDDFAVELNFRGTTVPACTNAVVPNAEGLVTDLPIGDFDLRVIPGKKSGLLPYESPILPFTEAVTIREGETSKLERNVKRGGWVDLDLRGIGALAKSDKEVIVKLKGTEKRHRRRVWQLIMLSEPTLGSGKHRRHPVIRPAIGAHGIIRGLLRPGIYTLEVTCDGAKPVKRPVVVHPGKMTTELVELRPIG